MLIKSAAATLGFGLLLTALVLTVQDVPFEPAYLGWTLLLSLPVGLNVYLGSLGTSRLEYPSASLAALMFWIVSVAPSFILDHRFDRLGLRYSEEAAVLGRWLFALWCFVFVLAAGRPRADRVRVEPKTRDLLALGTPIAAALTYQLIQGRFTNYQINSDSMDLGSDIVLAMGMGKNALVCLPGVLLLISLRVQSPMMVWAARLAIIPSVLLLLLTGGRSTIAFAVGVVFCLARLSGMRVRMVWAATMVVSIPIFFLIVFNYRTALLDSGNETVSLRGLTSVASDTTSDLATGAEQRKSLVVSFSENLRERLGLGPQFFAVVDGWLSDGAALEWTFADGILKAVPSVFLPEKNDLAHDYNFEFALQRSGRLPYTDLAPSPWMQWLFELGVAGIVIGAAFYGFLARIIERRIVQTNSSFELLFWAYMLSAMYAGESTTDSLALSARDAVALLGCAAVVSLLSRLLTGPARLRADARVA